MYEPSLKQLRGSQKEEILLKHDFSIFIIFSYFGMIRPDIHLPKSPGTGAGDLSPPGRWSGYVVPWRNPGQDWGINFDGQVALRCYDFPCGTAVKSASGTTNQFQKWNDPNIWRRVLVQLTGSEPCLGGVDIFHAKHGILVFLPNTPITPDSKDCVPNDPNAHAQICTETTDFRNQARHETCCN